MGGGGGRGSLETVRLLSEGRREEGGGRREGGRRKEGGRGGELRSGRKKELL